MDKPKVDLQRDVVKNERRQSYENAPYGMAEVRIPEILFPKNHPYHWPVIGYMDDLTAASADDVKEFFRKYYTPANAVLAIAGDFKSDELRKRIEYWFADVKPGPVAAPIEVPPAELTTVVKETMTDNVQLPRLYLTWLTPKQYAPGDAETTAAARPAKGSASPRVHQSRVFFSRGVRIRSCSRLTSRRSAAETWVMRSTACPTWSSMRWVIASKACSTNPSAAASSSTG